MSEFERLLRSPYFWSGLRNGFLIGCTILFGLMLIASDAPMTPLLVSISYGRRCAIRGRCATGGG
jgi:hypothetical protein